ncbi:hypothetical protein [Tabrizicola sp.]|uniref:hypothetical protein n=1 Tax=Tabrizicola sp. TaxID=2005166 RepID=UPI003F40FD76
MGEEKLQLQGRVNWLCALFGIALIVAFVLLTIFQHKVLNYFEWPPGSNGFEAWRQGDSSQQIGYSQRLYWVSNLYSAIEVLRLVFAAAGSIILTHGLLFSSATRNPKILPRLDMVWYCGAVISILLAGVDLFSAQQINFVSIKSQTLDRKLSLLSNDIAALELRCISTEGGAIAPPSDYKGDSYSPKGKSPDTLWWEQYQNVCRDIRLSAYLTGRDQLLALFGIVDDSSVLDSRRWNRSYLSRIDKLERRKFVRNGDGSFSLREPGEYNVSICDQIEALYAELNLDTKIYEINPANEVTAVRPVSLDSSPAVLHAAADHIVKITPLSALVRSTEDSYWLFDLSKVCRGTYTVAADAGEYATAVRLAESSAGFTSVRPIWILILFVIIGVRIVKTSVELKR